MNTKNESIKINGKNYAITFDERNKPILVEESAIITPYNVAYPCANGNYKIEWSVKFAKIIMNSQYIKNAASREEAQFICDNISEMLDNVLNPVLKKKIKSI